MKTYACLSIPRRDENLNKTLSYDNYSGEVKITDGSSYEFDEIWPPVNLRAVLLKQSPSFLSHLVSQLNSRKDSAVVFVNNNITHSHDFLLPILRALDTNVPINHVGFQCKSCPEYDSNENNKDKHGWFWVFAALVGSMNLHKAQDFNPVYSATVDLFDCKLKFIVVSFQRGEFDSNPKQIWQTLDLPCEVMRMVDGMDVAVVVDCIADKKYESLMNFSLNFCNKLTLVEKKLRETR